MAQSAKIDSLEERLKNHARAFDGLLSLIPAKHYYGEDRSDQWQKKKQTKEEKRAAKLAKLDPQNVKSAKDVLDEQAASARKRKRDEEEGKDDASTIEGITPEEPLSRALDEKKGPKKQKAVDNMEASISESVVDNSEKTGGKDQAAAEEHRAQERAAKRRAKAEKKAAKAEAKQAQRLQRIVEKDTQPQDKDVNFKDTLSNKEGNATEEPVLDNAGTNDLENVVDALSPSLSTRSPSSVAPSIAFDASNAHSGSSSISSIAPPVTNPVLDHETLAGSKHTDPSTEPKPSPQELKDRLQKRIEALRAARKADGVDGAPLHSRQELMEARRRKEEERKAHKKELRRKSKEEERRKHEETIARGSPLLSGSPLISPGSPATSSIAQNNFSFGRINFANGQRVSSSLNNILAPPKKVKGPSDARTALQAAQNQDTRIASLDLTKQASALEKEAWLRAKQRAEGGKVRDDTSLLKKTLKRKDKQKKKSEREWEERIAGVEKSKAAKQKKREINLSKRHEEKGSRKGGNKGQKSAKGKETPPKKARPGFEGTFRATAPKALAADKPRRR